MKTSILKFNNLSDIAIFIKTINPNGYTINTLNLTVCSKLNPFELALAIEQYGATLFYKEVIA
jgi:hypothetical protein